MSRPSAARAIYTLWREGESVDSLARGFALPHGVVVVVLVKHELARRQKRAYPRVKA